VIQLKQRNIVPFDWQRSRGNRETERFREYFIQVAFERRPRKKRAEKNLGYLADRLRIVKIRDIELR
jgi:hypothetical protein